MPSLDVTNINEMPQILGLILKLLLQLEIIITTSKS
jgi:hypothetical protein